MFYICVTYNVTTLFIFIITEFCVSIYLRLFDLRIVIVNIELGKNRNSCNNNNNNKNIE